MKKEKQDAKGRVQEELHQETQNTTEKEIKFRQLPHGLWVVAWEGGGELPRELRGGFTTVHQIQKAIKAYEARKEVVCLVQ